tara:strand:- start:49 stop:1395 length:1347 start_codon:yes stop_codon:yes gene_type:complete
MLYFFRFFFFLALSSFLFLGVAAQEANFSFDEDTGLKAKRKHLQTIDGVAAIVGERVVLNSDINQSLAMAIFQQKLDPKKDANKISQLRNEILMTTVDRKVVLLMAELDSVEVDDKEVDRALTQQVDNIVSQAGSEDAAEKALGQPLRTFKREYWYEIKDVLTTQKYQQTLMQKVSVSKKDVIGFFQTYKDSIPSFPSTVKLKHLLIKVVPDSSQEQKTISFLNDLRERILNKSSSFETLAADYSQDPGSKNSGGSLGFVRRGSLVTPFESIAFNLNPGEISKPIKTDFGYHIIETQEIRGDRIKVRHILMSPPTTEKDESSAYQKAIAIKDSSSSLSVFVDLVKKHTMDEQTKKSGGSLGWIDPGTYPIQEFSAVLGSIDLGVCAGPVRTDLGYHLLWVEAVRPGGKASLENHWSEIEAIALNKKKADWFKGWVTESRGDVFIHINK